MCRIMQPMNNSGFISSVPIFVIYWIYFLPYYTNEIIHCMLNEGVSAFPVISDAYYKTFIDILYRFRISLLG